MVRKYELMLVLSTDGDYESETKRQDIVKKLIGNATIDSLTLMGKKVLAYPIQKKLEGVYLLAQLSGEAMTVSSIQKKVTQLPEILRYLFIRKD